MKKKQATDQIRNGERVREREKERPSDRENCAESVAKQVNTTRGQVINLMVNVNMWFSIELNWNGLCEFRWI